MSEPTDTERLDALAARLADLEVYAGRARISVRPSDQFGVDPKQLRAIADQCIDSKHPYAGAGG